MYRPTMAIEFSVTFFLSTAAENTQHFLSVGEGRRGFLKDFFKILLVPRTFQLGKSGK